MELINILIVCGFIIVFACLFILYRYLSSIDVYIGNMALLLERTFKQYYKTENIKPQGVNWGIDLIWNPNDNEESKEKKGFITIYYGEDSGIDSPIDDVAEADILGQKIIGVVEKHLHDKELGVLR